jgi:Domain of unknown function (DUF4157)
MFAAPIQRKTAAVRAAAPSACRAAIPHRATQPEALGRLQRKPDVPVSDPADASEREADAVADRIMTMRAPIQRKCASCEDKDKLHAKHDTGAGGGGAQASTSVSAALQGPGAPLDAASRAYFEPRFGRDLSHVRVHTGGAAEASAASVGARAYTLGSDVVFGAGEHRLGTDGGKRLLAHELTHVVQQSDGTAPPILHRTITVTNPTAISPPHRQNNGAVVTGLFNGLCPDTTWRITDAGEVVPDTANFCSQGVGRSAMQTSCQCACNFTSASGPHASITIDPTASDNTQFSSSGPGNSFDITLRGLAATGITGVTGAPVGAGENSRRELSDPAWLILGHEMCGHAMTTQPNISTPGRASSISHESTKNWDQSAVDIENKIRREHSTPGNDLGTRMGDFDDPDGIHYGAIVEPPSSMTLITMMAALGVPTGSHRPRCLNPGWYNLCGSTAPLASIPMLDRVAYKTNGSLGVAERCLTQAFSSGDFFGMEGVFWHLADGSQNKTAIAARWGVTVAALDRANRVFAPSVATLAPADVVPANTSVIIPYRSAAGSTRYFYTPSPTPCD